MNTIGALYVAASEGLNDKRTQIDQYTCFIPEWSENAQGNKFVKEVHINYVQFVRVLKWLGFFRYDVDDNNYMIVRVKDNVLEVMNKTKIIDIFIEHINAIPSDHYLSGAEEKILNKLIANQSRWFSDDNLKRLRRESPIVFNKDTEHKAYFYYQNGFVEVTKKGILFLDYTKMPKYTYYDNGSEYEATKVIWKSQVLNRDFKAVSKTEFVKHDTYQFLMNIAKRDQPDRIDALQRLLGYLMHRFFSKKLKAVLLTDSNLSDKAEGRSGKTLVGRFLQKMLNPNDSNKAAVEMNGKEWKFDNPFKYQMLDLDTQLVILNDVRRKFRFEWLYNDIVDGVERQRKTEMPIKLNVKFLIPTNETIEMSSGSSKDRVVEFELSNHYNYKHQPEHDFNGRWFFGTTWNLIDWQMFDNVMLECLRLFLEKGLPTNIKSINLERRKLLDETAQEFINFMDDKIIGNVEKPIVLNVVGTSIDFCNWYNKKELYEEFKSVYSDFSKLSSKAFTSWVDKYVEYSGNVGKLDKIRSNSIEKLYFYKINDNTKTQPPVFVEDIPEFLK